MLLHLTYVPGILQLDKATWMGLHLFGSRKLDRMDQERMAFCSLTRQLDWTGSILAAGNWTEWTMKGSHLESNTHKFSTSPNNSWAGERGINHKVNFLTLLWHWLGNPELGSRHWLSWQHIWHQASCRDWTKTGNWKISRTDCHIPQVSHNWILHDAVIRV